MSGIIQYFGDFHEVRSFVKYILENPTAMGRQWSYQGFGMLRLYLYGAKEWRLHVWSPGMAVPGVTTIHNHPWDFESLVLSGRLRNMKFEESTAPDRRVTHHKAVIRCGEDACMMTAPESVTLTPAGTDIFPPGGWYEQSAAEIHHTLTDVGTVTLIRRRFGSDPDHASVYWPVGQKWVDATPRPATPEEINMFIAPALANWRS